MNTDDLRLLWDCVTRFHTRFFESESQPRSTQIRLLWEEVGEWYAEWDKVKRGSLDMSYERLTQEAVDIVFVAIGMFYANGETRYHTLDFVARPIHTESVNSPFGILSCLDTFSDMPKLFHVSPVLAELVIKLTAIVGDAADWHAAIETVITKNDAKTPEAGYCVNAGGKVTRVQIATSNEM